MTTAPAGINESQLRALYVDERLSKKAIARQLGCSDTTVAAAIRHFSLSRPDQPKITDGERQQIIDLYTRKRLPVRAIAEQSLASRDTILATLREAGIPLRGRGARIAAHLNAEDLRQRYEAGASLRDLAKAAETDDQVIREALVEAGVTVRGQGRIATWQEALSAELLRQKYVQEQQSLTQIAQEVGCSYQTVLAATRRHGIDLRGRRRPNSRTDPERRSSRVARSCASRMSGIPWTRGKAPRARSYGGGGQRSAGATSCGPFPRAPVTRKRGKCGGAAGRLPATCSTSPKRPRSPSPL